MLLEFFLVQGKKGRSGFCMEAITWIKTEQCENVQWRLYIWKIWRAQRETKLGRSLGSIHGFINQAYLFLFYPLRRPVFFNQGQFCYSGNTGQCLEANILGMGCRWNLVRS